MSKNYLLIISIICLCLVNIYLGILGKGLSKKFDLCTKDYELLNNKMLFEIRKYHDIILQYSKSANKIVDEDSKLITQSGDEVFLKEIINSKPKIFFKYFKGSCYSCIEKEFYNIRKVFSENELEKIIVLTDENLRYKIDVFINENQLKNDIYSINPNNCKLPFDSIKKPYIFTLDDTYLPQNLFIPIESNDSLSIKYYEYLENI